MSRDILADTIQAQHPELTKKAARETVDAVLASILEGLGSGSFALRDFGTFKLTKTKERPGRNPSTGASITLAAGIRVTFQPSPAAKAQLLAAAYPPVATTEKKKKKAA